MITVHHLNHSRSHRVLWLMEELELLYELKRYARDPKTMLAPAELKAIHPLGKSPVITDDDLTLAESAAILEYLLERYGNGRLAPQHDSANYRRFRYWMHYAEGSAMPPMLLKLVRPGRQRAAAVLRPPGSTRHSQGRQSGLHRTAAKDSPGLHGGGAGEIRLVRRRHIQRSGYTDELSDRGGTCQSGTGRESPKVDGFLATHTRAARL